MHEILKIAPQTLVAIILSYVSVNVFQFNVSCLYNDKPVFCVALMHVFSVVCVVLTVVFAVYVYATEEKVKVERESKSLESVIVDVISGRNETGESLKRKTLIFIFSAFGCLFFLLLAVLFEYLSGDSCDSSFIDCWDVICLF